MSSLPKLEPSLGLPKQESSLPNAGEEGGPSQQGTAATCVPHSLGKCICTAGERLNPKINLLQDDAINQCIRLEGEKVLTEGSYPDRAIWKGNYVLLKEHGVSSGTPGGSTYKATLTRIEKSSPDNYDDQNDQKQYVLVYGNPQKMQHCVYVTDKDATHWSYWNSYGNQVDKEKIEITKPGNQLFQVEVEIQEVVQPVQTQRQPVPASSNTMKIAQENVADAPTEEEKVQKMLNIIENRIYSICSDQPSFEETFAEDIGGKNLKQDYKNWSNNMDNYRRSMKLKIRHILGVWIEQRDSDVTPQQIYAKIEKLAQKDKIYNGMKRELKSVI